MFSFPRFPSGEFAPLFRLLDDYASHQSSRQGDDFGNFGNISQLRSFQPRFDVKEVKDSYELHGELPGVEQKDIQIEFTDAQTLSIKGRTERHRESGTPPTAALEGQQEQGRITASEESASDTSSQHYQKPTVEDENATPSTNTEQQITPTITEDSQVQQQDQQRPQSRYWVSERSVGEFSRSFAFPSRVDQDNVRASLKDGILSIVVPKASAPTTRKIHIE